MFKPGKKTVVVEQESSEGSIIESVSEKSDNVLSECTNSEDNTSETPRFSINPIKQM